MQPKVELTSQLFRVPSNKENRQRHCPSRGLLAMLLAPKEPNLQKIKAERRDQTATPKSATFATPSFVVKMFAPLMSR